MQAILRRRQCSPECRVSRGAPGSADCPNYSAREGVRPTRSRGAAPAARCSAPAPCRMLSPSSGAPAPAPRVNPPEGGERCRACLILPLGDPRVPGPGRARPAARPSGAWASPGVSSPIPALRSGPVPSWSLSLFTRHGVLLLLGSNERGFFPLEFNFTPET